VYHFVIDLLQPHTILTFLAGWALFRLWRKRKEAKPRLLPLALILFCLAVLSMPAVSHLVVLSLEWRYPPVEERAPEAEAIVLFSAGLLPPNGPRLRAELDEDALKRSLHAAQLYAQGPPCLVLVSGGKVDSDTPGPTPAFVMGDLLGRLGVNLSDLLLEESSQTTYENAVESAKLLKARGIRRVVLVVDAMDMLRAAGCLRKQGIEVVPSPCHYRATGFRFSLTALVPSPSGAGGVQRAWHEWLGTFWYWLWGRL
jgi:uncharacterized SAM-binding protein YcdF (DUF218 family)